MTYGFSHKHNRHNGGPPLDERVDTYEVKEALLDKFETLVTELVDKPETQGRKNRWGTNGSLSVEFRGPKRGSWFDHDANVGGGPFELIGHYEGVNSFKDRKRWAKNWLGWSEDRPAEDLHRRELLRRKRAEELARREIEAEQEEQRKIAEVKEYWTATIPAVGTLAEHYLKKVRSIPLETMPDVIRYHRGDRAAVVAATDETGEIVGLQRIYLTSDGKNVKVGAPGKLRNLKKSLGSLGGAAVRLPAIKPGPLCIAEGPETGLSVWAATGNETWIALGKSNIPSLTVPNGSTMVLLMDDDRPGPHKDNRKVNEAVKDWQRQGVTVYRAWPFEVRRKNNADFNDLIKEGGAEAVRERLRQVLTPQSKLSQLQFTLDHSASQMDQRIGEFFTRATTSTSSDLVQAMSITLGAGKTHYAILHGIAFTSALRTSGDQRSLVFAGPEHRLNAQLAKRLKKEAKKQGIALSVAVIRGREALLPGGDGKEQMCRNLEDIKLAHRHWAKADEVCEECPFKASCAYLDQRNVDADIYVVAHAMLTHEVPQAIGRRGIAALVVDESPWRNGLVGADGKGITLPLEALEDGGMRVTPDDEGKNLQFKRSKMLAAANINEDGPLKRSSLIAAEFLNDTASLGLEGAYARKVEDGNWRDRIDNRSLGQEVLAWKGAIELMAGAHEASGFISVGIEQDEMRGTWTRVLRLTGRREIGKGWQVPTLLIDASLNEALIKPYWPSVEVVARIDVETPYQRVWQCIHPFSKSMLTPTKKGDTKRKNLNRRHIIAYIAKLEREAGGQTLVVSNKETIEALKTDGIPDHIETAHFNALAGRDDWGKVARIIIIGRTQPPPKSVERMAGALTGKAPETLGDEWYQSHDVLRRQKTPTGVLLIAGVADRHPDPIAEAVRRRICEDEVMQALGRARGVRRTASNPVDVFVLSDAVLPIAVDGFIPLDDVIQTSPKDDMLAAGGVAFDSATAAFKAYPHLYRSDKAAQKKMERRNRETSLYENTLLQKCLSVRLVEVTYQRAGPKQKKGRATVDLSRHSDPRAAIEGLIGPLVFCEIVFAQPQAVSADVIAFPVRPSVEPVGLGSPAAPPPAPPLIEVPRDAEPRLTALKDDPVIQFSAVRLALHERNLSMEDAAESVGVSHPHLINMLMGRRRLTPEVQAGIDAMIKSTPVMQRRLL